MPSTRYHISDTYIGEGGLQIVGSYRQCTYRHTSLKLYRFLERYHLGREAVVRLYIHRGNVLGVASGLDTDGEFVFLTVERGVLRERRPCDIVAVGGSSNHYGVATAVAARDFESECRVVEHLEVETDEAVAASVASKFLPVSAGVGQNSVEEVECGVVADGVEQDCLDGVADEQMQYHCAVATRMGSRQFMVVNSCPTHNSIEEVVCAVHANGIVFVNHDSVVDFQMEYCNAIATLGSAEFVSVDTCGRVNGVVECVSASVAYGVVHMFAQGIFDIQIDMQYAVATLWRPQILTIPAGVDVGFIVHSNRLTSAYGVEQGIADSVGHNQVEMQYAVATFACTEILTIPAVETIGLVVHRPCLSGTNAVFDGVADGVVHAEEYHQIVVAVVLLTQVLCINALQVVRLSVGVEGTSSTNSAVDSVAYSVVDMQIHNDITIAAIDSGMPVNECLRSAERQALVGEGLTCAYRVVASGAEGVLNVQMQFDDAVATSIHADTVNQERVVDIGRRRAGNTMGIVHIATADGVVEYVAEGVSHVQTHFDSTVAACGQDNMSNAESISNGSRRDDVDTVATIDLATTDGVVHHIAECIIDMQMQLDGAVATCWQCDTIQKHSIVDESRWSADYAVIVVHIAAADGVVFNIAEGVVDMETDNHIAVAIANGLMLINHSSVVQANVGRTVGDEIIAIDKHITTTDGVVTLCAEGVVNMDAEVDVAVAACYRLVGVDYQGVGEVGPVRRVVDQVVAVYERAVATDGDVGVAVEGVVDVQTYLYGTVTAMDGAVHRHYCGVVEAGTVRCVADGVAVVASVAVRAVAAD